MNLVKKDILRFLREFTKNWMKDWLVSKFLAGKDYTIADIATFPWIARHEWHDIGLKKFEGLTRWYQEISKREAVIKGYDLLKNGEKIPSV